MCSIIFLPVERIKRRTIFPIYTQKFTMAHLNRKLKTRLAITNQCCKRYLSICCFTYSMLEVTFLELETPIQSSEQKRKVAHSICQAHQASTNGCNLGIVRPQLALSQSRKTFCISTDEHLFCNLSACLYLST